MNSIRTQAERFGAELVSDDVTALELDGPVKIVRTHDAEFTADTVILAMGSAYRKLGFEREDELSGHGVSWCATCDGFFFRNQDIAVVGGGDTAMEEATFLTRFANSVTVVHRRDGLRASRIMAERAEANPKIRWAWNSEVARVSGDTTLSGITLRDTVTGAERELAVGGLFIAIGHLPRSELVQGQLELDDEGSAIGVRATVEAFDRTGVEMEALTAVSIAALTVYDMLNGIDRAMEIGPTRLLQKSGGRTGDFAR